MARLFDPVIEDLRKTLLRMGGLAESILKAFLGASFEGGRHERRVKKIEGLESRDISGAHKAGSE